MSDVEHRGEIPPSALETLAFLTWLKQACGYFEPRLIGGGRYAAIRPLMFTHAIVVGKVGDRYSCDDRWCYADYDAARRALDAWDGTGEPQGWHRHPASGRRRQNGRPELEAVAP